MAQAAGRLRAVLAEVLVDAPAPELALVRRWLDSWSGLTLVGAGLARQGRDLQLTAYRDNHWRAAFFVTGMVHSIVGGSAWERTPWAAVQRAGWTALCFDR